MDTRATNRKHGSDMWGSVTEEGLYRKDLSKADASIYIHAFKKAHSTGRSVILCCTMGTRPWMGYLTNGLWRRQGGILPPLAALRDLRNGAGQMKITSEMERGPIGLLIPYINNVIPKSASTGRSATDPFRAEVIPK